MLTLLSPIALWSLAALALPLALHLWRQPPRTVLLPSLRFLQAQAGRRWRDLRWRERLLLLTRLGLLVALALLLAGPRWTTPPPRVPARWILLDPAAAPVGPSLARLRALQTSGYTTHLLAPGFPVTSQFADRPTNGSPDLWSLLREADASLPVGSALAIFSPARLTSLRGVRPSTHSAFEWIKTPAAVGDSSPPWIASLRPGAAPGASPVAVIGTSNAASLRFTASLPVGWKLDTQPDRARLLSPTNAPTPWTTLQTLPPLRVLILHDAAHATDARYLAAAVRAAADAAFRPVDLHSGEAAADLANLPSADWTFWLSDTVAPPAVANRHTHLLQDAPHADTTAADWIVPQPATPGLASPVQLWRRGPPAPGSTLWTDAHGQPLLTSTDTAAGPRWHFASRFHPDWTDLPRTTAFPAWLQSLLFGEAPPEANRDLRSADPEQARPTLSARPPPAVPLPPFPPASRDLHWTLWVLAALLFCLERFLSHSRRPTLATRTPPLPSETILVR